MNLPWLFLGALAVACLASAALLWATVRVGRGR